MTIKVHEPSPAVVEMSGEWPIAEALIGGTKAMRAAGERFLPRWPQEEPEAHAARIAVSTLYPAFRRTLSVMVGKPFAKPMSFGDDVPPRVREICEGDADLQGRNLHVFAQQPCRDALAFGVSGVLVDFPRTDGVRTQADERNAGARPYLVYYRHDQILGGMSEVVNGATRLTMLRLAETAEVPDGEYGVECKQRVRVLRPGSWELYERVSGVGNARGEIYVLIEGGGLTVSEIPFVFFFGEQTGPMTGRSPLVDLAYLNAKHWQSQSDQDHIMHVARVPILFAKGFEDSDKIVVGSSSAVKTTNATADLRFIEHSGAAIGAGAASLAALEQQMVQTGAELLVVKPGDRTATESNNDADANKCDLQRISESWEDSIDQVLMFLAEWLRLPDGGHASLFKDFGAATLTDASAQLVLSMQQGGLITKQTAIREQQRRGVLSADVHPDDELQLVQEEGPALGALGQDGGVPAAPGAGAPASGSPAPQGSPPPAPAAGPAPPAPPLAAGAQDLTPILAAIREMTQAMTDNPHASAPPLDLAPHVAAIVAALNEREPVTLEASIDTSAIAAAVAEALRSVPAPSVTVNAPAVDLDPLVARLEKLAAPVVNVTGADTNSGADQQLQATLDRLSGALEAMAAPKRRAGTITAPSGDVYTAETVETTGAAAGG